MYFQSTHASLHIIVFQFSPPSFLSTIGPTETLWSSAKKIADATMVRNSVETSEWLFQIEKGSLTAFNRKGLG